MGVGQSSGKGQTLISTLDCCQGALLQEVGDRQSQLLGQGSWLPVKMTWTPVEWRRQMFIKRFTQVNSTGSGVGLP